MPNRHFENLYDLPPDLGARIHTAAQACALAMKIVDACAGVSTRQHNEPVGNQDVWHYHLHVFPRYPGDALYTSTPSLMAAEVRAGYAHLLRNQLVLSLMP